MGTCALPDIHVNTLAFGTNGPQACADKALMPIV